MLLMKFSNVLRFGSRPDINRTLSTTFNLHINRYPSTDTKQFKRSYSKTQTSNTMKFIQFQRGNDQKVHLGSLSDDGNSFISFDDTLPNNMIDLIKSNVSAADIERVSKTKSWEPLSSDIKLLAPIQNPEKIVCIGLNYLGHCKEQNKEAPKEPMFFSKYSSTITGPTGDVILHEITKVYCVRIEIKL